MGSGFLFYQVLVLLIIIPFEMNRFPQKQYNGFTLVEMLIVMGILVILMTIGVAAGRFALQRANRIQHSNAADQFYQALQSYYTDKREYPDLANPKDLFAEDILGQYIDTNAWDGGSDASYYYYVDSTNQYVLICVSYGGFFDQNQQGFYCNGNGFGDEYSGIQTKEVDHATGINLSTGFNSANGFSMSKWNGDDRAWISN